MRQRLKCVALADLDTIDQNSFGQMLASALTAWNLKSWKRGLTNIFKRDGASRK
jgi:hypothetical protein